MTAPEWVISALTPDRWDDFERLFGPRGACGGCWCAWWRLKRSEFDLLRGEGNRRYMQALVNSGDVPGLLAYQDGQPVGWYSVAPRAVFPVLDRSRVLKRVDDQPVWSVVCFFIQRNHRRQGLSVRLLAAALAHARSAGAEIVEGYPIDPARSASPDVFAFTGLVKTFLAAGFVEVARRSPTRPIMRRLLTLPG
jgi:GNAT superfamily N-acetyltransferase